MKKSDVLAHPEGSAERHIAHAKWRRSRGKQGPTMSYLEERDPRKAVIKAKVTLYSRMTSDEIAEVLRGIVGTSQSEPEIIRRIRKELGYSHVVKPKVCMRTFPTVVTELLQSRRGLVAANGAMVSVTMITPEDGVTGF